MNVTATQSAPKNSGQYNPARSVEELLERWMRRLRQSQTIHYEEAKRLKKYNLFLGVPVVVFTAIVGTAVFASLSEDANLNTGFKIVIGSVSVVSAVLASLQTFLGFNERAEKHRATAARYGIARRQVETLIASGPESADEEKLNNLRASIDNLALDAPGVTNKSAQTALSMMQNWRDDH